MDVTKAILIMSVIALSLTSANVLADPLGKAEYEARKEQMKNEREALKKQQEQEREALKKQQEMEREERKHQEEMERDQAARKRSEDLMTDMQKRLESQ